MLPKTIYGPDDRQDYWALSDGNLRRMMAGTVMVLHQDMVEILPDNRTFEIRPLEPLGVSKNLCSGQTFETQLVPDVEYSRFGLCSGFFVSPTVVVTAGHCVDEPGAPVDQLVFVSGFWMTDPDTQRTTFDANSLYDGVRVLRMMHNGTQDFALIQVECRGPSPAAQPLKLAPTSDLQVGDLLMATGHPSGLPMKFCGNAIVRDCSELSDLTGNLDLFDGNSGSPVYNAACQVVGIHVRGERGYDPTPQGCWVVRFQPNDGGVGKDFQRIDGVIGRIRDISITLGIGERIPHGGRRVLLRLRSGVEPVDVPGDFSAGSSTTIRLEPTDFGIATTEDISEITINSPTNRIQPPGDAWTLTTLTLSINGGQPLYKFLPDHTFENASQPATHTWQVNVGRVTDAWTVSTARRFSGALSSVTAVPGGRPEVSTFGKDNTGRLVRMSLAPPGDPVWSDCGPLPGNIKITSAVAATKYDDNNLRAYFLSGNQLIEWVPGRRPSPWNNLGVPPYSDVFLPALTAVARPGPSRLDVLGVSDLGWILRCSYSDISPGWKWYDVGTPPESKNRISGGLTASARDGEVLDLTCLLENGDVLRVVFERRWWWRNLCAMNERGGAR